MDWIKTEGKVPEYYKTVLCHWGKCLDPFGLAYYTANEGWRSDDGNTIKVPDHWQHLVEPEGDWKPDFGDIMK